MGKTKKYTFIKVKFRTFVLSTLLCTFQNSTKA